MNLTSVLKPQEKSVHYRTRKLFTSLKLRDQQDRFLLGFPGSVHNSGLYPPVRSIFLVDEGCPCLERPLGLVKP